MLTGATLHNAIIAQTCTKMHIIIAPKVRKLSKSELDAIRYRGIIARVAARTGMAMSTVSRTLRGEIKRPNPTLVRLLEAELDKFVSECE
jgi:transcriptional regulator with XRE-family HTH domain